eukprot:c13186_g1_i1 orf=48-230(+)
MFPTCSNTICNGADTPNNFGPRTHWHVLLAPESKPHLWSSIGFSNAQCTSTMRSLSPQRL